MVKRFDVVLVNLDFVASEKPRMARPCVVVSPDEMNRHLDTIIVAPLTTKKQDFPTRIPINFNFKGGQIALEQLRAVDRSRLVKTLGRVGDHVQEQIVAVLQELFAA